MKRAAHHAERDGHHSSHHAPRDERMNDKPRNFPSFD